MFKYALCFHNMNNARKMPSPDIGSRPIVGRLKCHPQVLCLLASSLISVCKFRSEPLIAAMCHNVCVGSRCGISQA